MTPSTIDIVFDTEDTTAISVAYVSNSIEICGIPSRTAIEALTACLRQEGKDWYGLLDEVPLDVIHSYLEAVNE